MLSSAHFLDHGTIPLLGINSDPMQSSEEKTVKNKKSDERRYVLWMYSAVRPHEDLIISVHFLFNRSHGALCMCTAHNMKEGVAKVLHGGARLGSRTRIHCVVKSTFSETRLVPALNDLLIANPSPAAVSRYRMGWLEPIDMSTMGEPRHSIYGTTIRFGGNPYENRDSLNVWSSGMWVSTATGSTAAMAAAGGTVMDLDSRDLQYLIREHMIENDESGITRTIDNGMIKDGQKLHLRWNSQKGRVFIDVRTLCCNPFAVLFAYIS